MKIKNFRAVIVQHDTKLRTLQSLVFCVAGELICQEVSLGGNQERLALFMGTIKMAVTLTLVQQIRAFSEVIFRLKSKEMVFKGNS